ncbi:MAG: tetratricopeptide repeat protein [Candidatus Eiseniibacteriota bacterium]|jgi:tetratricopeptide (TPR) repeat protein
MTRSAVPVTDDPSAVLRGKVFVFTGRLASLSRREAAALVRVRGGETRRQVSRQTSYLVVGDGDRGPAGSRSRSLLDARRVSDAGAELEIIDERRFLTMLGLESACRLRDRYYSGRDIQRLYGFDRRTLRALANVSLVSPILRTNAERYYTFSDLLVFRTIHESLEQGGSLGRIVRRLLQDRAGQARLDFDRDELEVLPLDAPDDHDWSADDWYLMGCEHDERPAEVHEAIAAYRRVLELDPYHVGALINLGNLSYDLGDIDEARSLYERALASDPQNAVAHFNLGNVYDDLGEYARAISYFRSAIRLRPDNADAHFNLGLVYDRLGEVSRVRAHMELYLRLSADGDMAEVAREYLQLTEEEPDPAHR